jgi:hypothetical protein
MASLAADNFFHQDASNPLVQRALRHWTGEERLGDDEAEGSFFVRPFCHDLEIIPTLPCYTDIFDEDNYAFRTHVRPFLAKIRCNWVGCNEGC